MSLHIRFSGDTGTVTGSKYLESNNDQPFSHGFHLGFSLRAPLKFNANLFLIKELR
jgi:hypothetical protein